MTKTSGSLVAIIIGSDSDRQKMVPCIETLTDLGIPWELSVISCHRHPLELQEYLESLLTSGTKVVIAAAGMAAQLPGVVAARLKNVGISVIGVAFSSENFPNGLDALLSITRMPPGVPLVCAGIDNAGAKNAALFAANILVMSKFVDPKKLILLYKQLKIDKPAQLRSEVWSPESV